jgi:hypothetical protein
VINADGLATSATASPDPRFSLPAARRDASLGNEKLFAKCSKTLRTAKFDSAAKNEITRKNNMITVARILKRPFAVREDSCSSVEVLHDVLSKSRSFKRETES